MSRTSTLILCLLAAVSLAAPSTLAQASNKRRYIEAADGCDVFNAAAIAKKTAAIDIVTDIDNADYVMQTSRVEKKKASAAAKFANCLFAMSGVGASASAPR